MNKVDYSIVITNSKSKKGYYQLNIVFKDTYDFEYQKWTAYGNTPKAVLVALINNKAYEGQLHNHIVTYKVKINCKDTIKK